MLTRWGLLLLGVVASAGTAAACGGLSPGDPFSSDTAAGCTLGFLVAAPDGLYFSTAGHCVQVDDRVSSPDFGEWGRGAFHFLEPETGSETDGSPGMDFGLIRIHPDTYASLNPKMCGWDGPTGIYVDSPGSGGVKHWGHGMVFGDLGETGQRREGVQMSNDGDAFYWVGAGVPGDSGSAVIADDGRALGVLTHLNVGVASGGAVTNGGTHIERGFRLAAEEGFTQLRLVLAGEDPVKVLAELRNAPPPSAAQPATPSPGAPAPTPGATAPPSSQSPPPTNASGDANDSLAPAATQDDVGSPSAPKDTPFPSTSVALLASVAVALALGRKR